MRIKDLLAKESIQLNGSAQDKKDVLNQMVDLMAKSGKISDVDTYRKGVFAREEEGTTGVGEGIAIPHCKSDAVKAPGLAAMTVPAGVEYEALDGAPVDILFLIAAPNTKDNVHLDVLSKLSVLLMNEEFTSALKAAKNPDEFLSIIDKAESEADGEEKPSEVASANGKYVLAVTACPTGIAHTYMAAEALEMKAAAMGVGIKVETRGSSGAKNVLTAEDIKKADGIIVAADTKVPMDRFDGKPVITCKVADGINKAEDLIKKAAAGDAPAFKATGAVKADDSSDKGSIGHQIYKHLMSGVSHMLPFVIGGGILVALAFLIDTLAGYGATAGGDFGTMTALSALLKYIGGLGMGLMVPVLAGYIAYSIADRPGLAVGFVGGMLASSGNAAVMGTFAGSTGFMGFIERFAFVGEGGGATVSGFLGGIVAGFLAGYIVLGLQKAFSKLPASLDGIKPTLIYPLLGILCIGLLMCFIFNPLIGVINTALSTMLTSISNAGYITILGLLLGAMMAIDMGGPINKAAYVFGTGMLATAASLTAGGALSTDPAVVACYIAMASIMVGGMVPPVGIAIACLVFPKKFTKAEKGSVVSNFVMGASFITEGAIPFAAADPGHVIPATMAGAGVAGFLSALFGCTLMAPHGGIFVFATVGNPLLYVVAWLVGSVITAVLLGVLKKNAQEV